MTPSAAHSLRLWLALSRLPTDPHARTQVQQLLAEDIASPLTDVKVEWEGQSLLLAALPYRMIRAGEGPSVDLQHPLKIQDHEVLPLALLDRGVNPWQRLRTTPELGDDDPHYLKAFYTQTVPQGFGPALMALRTQSWATLAACLRHPLRPDWDTVMAFHESNVWHLGIINQRAGLAKALLEGGLPINWQDADGQTLLHHVRSAPLASWLLRQGADPTLTNRAGDTPLRAQENEQRLSPDLRRVLAQASQGAPHPPRDLWGKALTGKNTELLPYFAFRAAGDRDMAQWRWESPVGAVNLLDAASLAAARRKDSSRPTDDKPEFAVLNKLLALPTTWPEASVALARLVIQHQPEEEHPRLRVKAEHLVPLSDEDRRVGMQQFLRLSALPVPANSENFWAWQTAMTTPLHRTAALDIWLAWAQARTTPQWGRLSSVGRRHIKLAAGTTQHVWEVTRPEAMSDRQYMAMMGETLVSRLVELKRNTYTKEEDVRHTQAIKALVPLFVKSVQAAGASLHDPEWVNLTRALQTSAAPLALYEEITALLRVNQMASIDAPSLGRRRRLRS